MILFPLRIKIAQNSDIVLHSVHVAQSADTIFFIEDKNWPKS